MARAKSSEKRAAILRAAVHEIAKAGLGAPTAKTARRTGIAAGTLFTDFANKEELLNQLYLELKGEVYTRVNTNFPHKGSLPRVSTLLDFRPTRLRARSELRLRSLRHLPSLVHGFRRDLLAAARPSP